MKKLAVIYWLIPAEPYRELFRDLIRILARQFDAPAFEPHLTLCRVEDRQSLRRLKAARIRLAVREVAVSAKFTKTLFVRFDKSEPLTQLIVDLGGKPTSARDPHLSLLYKRLAAPTKQEIAATIELPFRQVVFGAVWAVQCPTPTETADDVKAWRTLARKSLHD